MIRILAVFAAMAVASQPVMAAPKQAAKQAAGPAPTTPLRKPDLADLLEGVWEGDVISDSKGSSKSDVLLKLERVGPNTLRIVSNYPRLPVIRVTVERVMAVIMQSSGNSVFLYDPTRTPARLDVSFNNEVSWSGRKQ